MGEDNEYSRFVGEKFANWNAVDQDASHSAEHGIRYAEWTEAQMYTSGYKMRYPIEYEPSYIFAGRLPIPRPYKSGFTLRVRQGNVVPSNIETERSAKRSRFSGVFNGAKRRKDADVLSRVMRAVLQTNNVGSKDRFKLARSHVLTATKPDSGFWSRLWQRGRNNDNERSQKSRLIRRQVPQKITKNRRHPLLLVAGLLGLTFLIMVFPSMTSSSSTRRSSVNVPSRPIFVPSFVSPVGSKTDTTPLGKLLSETAQVLELPATAWGLAQPTTSPNAFAYSWKVPRASGLIDTVSVAGEGVTLKEYLWESYEEQNNLTPSWDESEQPVNEQLARSAREFVYALVPEQELLLNTEIYLSEVKVGEEYLYTFRFPWQSTGEVHNSGIEVVYDLRWQRVTRLRVIDPR